MYLVFVDHFSCILTVHVRLGTYSVNIGVYFVAAHINLLFSCLTLFGHLALLNCQTSAPRCDNFQQSWRLTVFYG